MAELPNGFEMSSEGHKRIEQAEETTEALQRLISTCESLKIAVSNRDLTTDELRIIRTVSGNLEKVGKGKKS